MAKAVSLQDSTYEYDEETTHYIKNFIVREKAFSEPQHYNFNPLQIKK